MTDVTRSWPRPDLDTPQPHPVEALEVALGIRPDDPCRTAKLALRLGLSRRTIVRYRRRGLTATQADHWATAGDLWAEDVWPDWMPPDTDDEHYADDPPIDHLGCAPHPSETMPA